MQNRGVRILTLIIFVVVIGGSLTNIYSQQQVDSLVNALHLEEVDSVKMSLYIELGNEVIYTSHGDALSYYSEAKKLAQKNNNHEKLILSVLGMCDVYGIVGEYKKGIHTITDVIDVLLPDHNHLFALCNGRLATAYANLGEDSLALKYDKLSLKYNLLEKYDLGIAYDYGNIATFYINHENYDSANLYLDLCLETLPDTIDLLYAITLDNKASICFKKEEYNESLDLFKEVLLLYKTKDKDYQIASAENDIASVFYELNEIDSAYHHAILSLDICNKLNNHNLFVSNYDLLYLIYESTGDYKNALKYSRLEHVYADSVSKKNNENIISTIKTRYEFEEQRKVLETTQIVNAKLTEQRKQFLMLSIVVIMLLITSVFSSILKFKEQKKNKELVIQLNRVNQSIRKLLLIIGHDLRDSVGNLKNFTQLMHHQLLDKKSIKVMISKFIPMVDSTHSLLETLLVWTKSKEEAFNLKLEQINSNEIVDLCVNQISYLAKSKHILLKHNVEKVVFNGDKNMLLIVLRNLVSNAIKFSDENSSIQIICSVKDEELEFAVKDAGVGMTEEEMAKVLDENVTHFSEGTMGERGSGMGLALCNSFIVKHGGHVSVSSIKGQGSTFSFVVPVNYK